MPRVFNADRTAAAAFLTMQDDIERIAKISLIAGHYDCYHYENETAFDNRLSVHGTHESSPELQMTKQIIELIENRFRKC